MPSSTRRLTICSRRRGQNEVGRRARPRCHDIKIQGYAMEDEQGFFVSGSTPQEVGRSVAKTIQALSPALGRRLRAVLIDYIQRFDDEAFTLLNTSTVRQ